MRKLAIILLLVPVLVTGQTTKNFTFDTNSESWAFTSGGKTTGSFDGAETALDNNCAGRNSTDVSYWEWTGTWQDLGVTSGDIVTAVTLDFDWKCYVANTSDGYSTGPAEIWSSDGLTQIGTFSSGSSGSGTTGSYATQSGSSVSIGSTYQASTTIIKLRVSISPDNGNNSSAETGLYYDNIDLTITHETPSTSRRIFIIN